MPVRLPKFPGWRIAISMIVLVFYFTFGSQLAASDAPPAPATAPTIETVAPPPTTTSIGWDALGAIAGAIATLLAALSAWQSHVAAKEASAAARQTERAGQASQLASLWTDMAELTFLDPAEISQLSSPQVAVKVRNNVNHLGKIAFFWRTRLVDRETLEKELGAPVAELYEQILSIGTLTELNRSGAELLDENPAVKPLYRALRKRYPPPPP